MTFFPQCTFVGLLTVENPVHRALFDAVMSLDLNATTPLEALFKISELQRRAHGKV